MLPWKTAQSSVTTPLDVCPHGSGTPGKLADRRPDYPDPTDYLVFTPGQLVGPRAGWAATASPDIAVLANKAKEGAGGLYRTFARRRYSV